MKRHFQSLRKPLANANPESPLGKLESYLGRVQLFLQEFLTRAGKPVDTMYRVAVERHKQGEYEDAASRLRIVTRFQPENADAWYLRGACELALGENATAVASLKRALIFKPQMEEARFLLAVAEPTAIPEAQHPKYPPLTLATEYFDLQAWDYDAFNLGELGYRGHEECLEAVRKYLNPNYTQFRIVDLGCGTGLVGLQFREIAGHVEGVDISQNMLDQAEARRDERESRVYDKLHLIDLRRFLLDQPAGSCDILTAANVFPYVGGLTPVFDGANHVLRSGGLFTFSIEPLPEGDFGLIPYQGRFAHSEQYIRDQATRVGLDVLEVKPFELFHETDALQFVLRKPAPAAANPTPPQAPV